MSDQLKPEEGVLEDLLVKLEYGLHKAGLLHDFNHLILSIAHGHLDLNMEDASGGLHSVSSREKVRRERDGEILQWMLTKEVQDPEDPPSVEDLAAFWAELRQHLQPEEVSDEEDSA